MVDSGPTPPMMPSVFISEWIPAGQKCYIESARPIAVLAHSLNLQDISSPIAGCACAPAPLVHECHKLRLRKPRWMHLFPHSKETAETHDQWTPFLRIYVRTRPIPNQQRLFHAQPRK